MRLSATLLLPLVGLATVWAQAAPPPLFPAPSPDEARIGLAALAESALTATAAGGPLIAPLVYAIPVQLLAYHVACVKGTDVDQPRNLAKSVTVE